MNRISAMLKRHWVTDLFVRSIHSCTRAVVKDDARNKLSSADVRIVWTDLSYSVDVCVCSLSFVDICSQVGHGKQETLLFNVFGCARKGKLLALLGPSGSGKVPF